MIFNTALEYINFLNDNTGKSMSLDTNDLAHVMEDYAVMYNERATKQKDLDFNKVELEAEDLECVKMWLNDKNVPTNDSDGNQYSVIGRI